MSIQHVACMVSRLGPRWLCLCGLYLTLFYLSSTQSTSHVLPLIHTQTHGCCHGHQKQQCLAHGSVDTWLGGVRDRTANPAMCLTLSYPLSHGRCQCTCTPWQCHIHKRSQVNTGWERVRM